jgi:hypothetical protein
LGLCGAAVSLGSAVQVLAAEETFPYRLSGVVLDPSSTATLFATGRGITANPASPASFLRSQDSGQSWTAVTTPPGGGACQAVGSPTILLCGGVDLYRSDDLGESWSLSGFSGFLNEFDNLWLSPSSSSVIYATFGGVLYRSFDTGRTWVRSGPGLPNFAPPVIAVDPQDSRIAYAVVTLAPARINPDEGLYRTSDGGNTWSVLVLHFSRPFALVVDPSRPTTIFASACVLSQPFLPCSIIARRSDDSGASWSPTSMPVTGSDGRGTLYSGAQGSVDHGEHWEPLPLPVDPLFTSSGSTLIVGEVGHDIFGSTDSGATWFPMSSPEVTGCFPAGDALCLGGGRFRAWIRFTAPNGTGVGHPVSLTTDTGAFWFFSANNIELALKVVDGRAVNGKFWVFGGALTDVEYDLEIFDTTTGFTWRRHNSQDQLVSFADTTAF